MFSIEAPVAELNHQLSFMFIFLVYLPISRPTLLFVLQKCVISSHCIFPDRDDVTILEEEMCLIYTNITDIELDSVEPGTMNTETESTPLELSRSRRESGVSGVNHTAGTPALISSASSCIQPIHSIIYSAVQVLHM